MINSQEEIHKNLKNDILRNPFKVFKLFYTAFYFPGYAHFKIGVFPKGILFPLVGIILVIALIFSFFVQSETRSLSSSLRKFAIYQQYRSTSDSSMKLYVKQINKDADAFANSVADRKETRTVLVKPYHINNLLKIFNDQKKMDSSVAIYDKSELNPVISELEVLKANLSTVQKEVEDAKNEVRKEYSAKIEEKETELQENESAAKTDPIGKLQQEKQDMLKSAEQTVYRKYASLYERETAPVLHSLMKKIKYLDLAYKYDSSGTFSLYLFLSFLLLFFGFWAYTVFDFVRLLQFGALNRMIGNIRDGLGFLSLNIVGFMTFVFGPVIFAIFLAFNKWDILTEMSWVGLDNFKTLISDPLFWKYMGNTFFFFINVPLGMATSLMLAMALNQKIRGITVFRVLFYLPVVSSIVAVALLWRWIYNPDYGLLNSFIRMFGVVHPPAWLNSTTWVKPAISIMEIWKGMGYGMLLYLAALQGVPAYLFESADIDGANRWHKFRYITLPLLGPTHFYCIITGVIGTFQAFGSQYVMTQGGPAGASTTIVYYVYNNAFQWFKMGYAAAIALVLFAMVFIVTIINWRVAGNTLYTE